MTTYAASAPSDWPRQIRPTRRAEPRRARSGRGRAVRSGSGQVGPAVDPRLDAVDRVHDDPVRHVDAAHGDGHRPLQQVERHRRAADHPALRAAAAYDVVDRGRLGAPRRPEVRPARPRRARRARRRAAPRCRAGTRPAAASRVGGRPGGVDRGSAVAEREQGEGYLVHAVGPDQVADPGVGEESAQPGIEAGAGGGRLQLGEQRAGVPVEVPPSALGVAPAGAPRDARHDQSRRRHRSARGRPGTRACSLAVVPVHAVGHAVDATRAGIDLEREARAGRAGGAEEDASLAALRRSGRPRRRGRGPGPTRRRRALRGRRAARRAPPPSRRSETGRSRGSARRGRSAA